ncbi:hypothetical protein SELMODRAFT_413777 [Selaginella moellendorffii]|uniref:Bulb-type lectin domain-containing protein n=1 Tax=Selaginella moellendorffii TaxID=88036 RepID=D8RQ69_SELML|nr:hypothetical protein SELMODRAFT_413777 [Selaginella moellendorffii]
MEAQSKNKLYWFDEPWNFSHFHLVTIQAALILTSQLDLCYAPPDGIFRIRALHNMLTVEQVRAVVERIQGYVRNIRDNVRFGAGRTMELVVIFDRNTFVNVYLFVYSRVFDETPGICTMRPTIQDVRGQNLRQNILDMCDRILEELWDIERWYGYVDIVLQHIGLHYELDLPKSNRLLFFNFSSVNTSDDHKDEKLGGYNSDIRHCWVYTTSLVSGSRNILGSYLLGGNSLISSDSSYRLTMQKNCNLVLQSPRGIITWSSGTQGKDSNCYLILLANGKLVILGSRGEAWSSKIISIQKKLYALVIENLGYLAIYRTDTATLVWKSL